jgi:membrane protease YdiL (CAAX protease family)
VAIVGSSAVFGLVHFQLLQFPALMVVGVVNAVLTLRTGRLGPAVCAHVAFNGTAVAVQFVVT